jgi:hypothetical protein
VVCFCMCLFYTDSLDFRHVSSSCATAGRAVV